MRFVVLFVAGALVFTAACEQPTSSQPEPRSPDPSAEFRPSADLSPVAVAEKTAPKDAAGQDAPEPPQFLSREQFEAGWISLFDGHSLFGWKPNCETTNWSVQDGVIQADAGDPGMLMTTVELADYELQCDFRLEKGGNSGIFLRTLFDPQDASKDCYELNICDSHPEFPTGSLAGRKKAEKKTDSDGQWNTFHVRLEGAQIQVKLNGDVVMDLTDTSETARQIGHIGLQMKEGKVEFRNVLLRPLGMKSIFNGKDLTGWREVPGSKSEFAVVDGAIHVTNGAGFLETEKTWADFVLRADVKVNGEHLNSGIFFRAKPGTEEAPSHGYEMQIHNGYVGGNRSKPKDHGTGAIFKRAMARWVVGNDDEWLTTLLIAHGPHFATWVNGYQVVDWTDTRKPDENPRKGLRLKPGHLSLQGHDPTTDLDFKNLQVVALRTQTGN